MISNNERSHQNLQDKIQLNATSMGLTFKPSKCRTLSLVRGKPQPVAFFLTDPISGEKVQLKTLESDPHKFLGCVMTFNNSPQDHLKFLSSLENIDKTKVRAEYKVAIYTRYALPSLRYHLTVHTLHLRLIWTSWTSWLRSSLRSGWACQRGDLQSLAAWSKASLTDLP